jgi:hypothetical protein
VFTADELARIQDAVNAVDAVAAPYGVTITLVDASVGNAADVVLDTGSTSVVGGYADGVLGCYADTGEITLIQGWNWYAGADPSQVGTGQYDFQTVVTHELGHALGLGESSDPASVMFATLTTGAVNRALTVSDLNVPYDEPGGDAMHADVPASTIGQVGQRDRVAILGFLAAPSFELARLTSSAAAAFAAEPVAPIQASNAAPTALAKASVYPSPLGGTMPLLTVQGKSGFAPVITEESGSAAAPVEDAELMPLGPDDTDASLPVNLAAPVSQHPEAPVAPAQWREACTA